MLAAARSKLCRSVSAWSGVFASIAMSTKKLNLENTQRMESQNAKIKDVEYVI